MKFIRADQIIPLFEQNNICQNESQIFLGTRNSIMSYLISHFNDVSHSFDLKVSFDSHFFSPYWRDKSLVNYKFDLSYFCDKLPHKIGFHMVPIAFMHASSPAKLKYPNVYRWYYTYLEMI